MEDLKNDEWRKKREIAHWILSKALAILYVNDEGYFIMKNDGNISGINEEKDKIYFAKGEILIDTLINENTYPKKEIYGTINLLISNNHVIPEKDYYKDKHLNKIIVTQQGRQAFEGLFYLNQIKQAKKESLEISFIKASKKSIFWSPFFAGLAALMAVLTYVNGCDDKAQALKLQQLQNKLLRLDSVQQIRQIQIDSLLIRRVHLEGVRISYPN